MITDIDYHLQRARSERDIAYRSGNACVSDAHLRLSALHLARALLLQEVRRAPVGNVIPIRLHPDYPSRTAVADTPGRLIELPACG
jgi:hypothetical protein